MASNETESTNPKPEWEEVMMMIEIPSAAKLSTSFEEDLPLQVLGLWSEEPVVKFDNMVYTGKIKNPLGSYLMVESKENGFLDEFHKNFSSLARAVEKRIIVDLLIETANC